ncbi:hypothetical protein PsorP6_007664 [Peronosclerospora sorghi]|uniref:Uncharacterized protein n=1 Tax=Peronosclerospora sorghi TaxID=230839 RepID=A0ACC0W9D0_9STRA|nr:hypothetical protein PsorP6_007664 [Peronosclerospora sorghi]
MIQTSAVVFSLGARAVESERTALATSRGDTRANRLAVIGTTTIAHEIHFTFIAALSWVSTNLSLMACCFQ